MKYIKIKRIYETFDDADGMRVLVDGLWPRGIKKENAHIDLWLKDIAPSSVLRKWFSHDPEKWPMFCDQYNKELNEKTHILKPILDALLVKDVTLLYASKEEKLNNAVVLQNYILKIVH